MVLMLRVPPINVIVVGFISAYICREHTDIVRCVVCHESRVYSGGYVSFNKASILHVLILSYGISEEVNE